LPGKTVARWAVEAGITVEIPRVTPVVDPSGGQVYGATIGLFSLNFDETTGRGTSLKYPLKKRVHTRVSLIGVSPLPE
jgi:hypothetical protein